MSGSFTINHFDSKTMDFKEWSKDFTSFAKVINCSSIKLPHLLRLHLDSTGKRALDSLPSEKTNTLTTLMDAMK